MRETQEMSSIAPTSIIATLSTKNYAPNIERHTQQPQMINIVRTTPEDRLTVLEDTIMRIGNTKSAITKDSLFQGRLHNCKPPTVEGQFDDVEDDEEKDVALTLLNARNVSATGYAISTISSSNNINGTNGTNTCKSSRSMLSPVSLHQHQNQFSQHQYHDNYHLHQRILPLTAPSSLHTMTYPGASSGERSTTTGEIRETMAQEVAARNGGTMNRLPLRSRLQSIPPQHIVSFPQHKVIDGGSKCYHNTDQNWNAPDPRTSEPIYDPKPADVLFGRGGAVNTHPGNVFFRSQVTQHHQHYVKAQNHAEKSLVVRLIRDAIKARGGRFLKCNTTSKVWYIVDERDATVKTMQSLRDVRTSNEAGEIDGISPYPNEVFSSKHITTEGGSYHDSMDGNCNYDIEGKLVEDTSHADQATRMVSSDSIISTRLTSSSLPSKKRPLKVEPMLMKSYMAPSLSSSESIENVKKRIKQHLTSSSTSRGSVLPSVTSTPALNMSIRETAIPNAAHSLSSYRSNAITPAVSPSSNTEHTNYLTKMSLHQQRQQLSHAQQFAPDTDSNFQNITLLRPEDVLSGRGGGTNRHPGNIHFRRVVSEAQPNYVKSRKKNKSSIARDIVQSIRNKNGRFLKFHPETGLWHDVGDKKATEKTSQALREGLAGSSGNSDDGVVVGNSVKKDLSLQYNTQITGVGRIKSDGKTSFSDEPQDNSIATTWSTCNDSDKKNSDDTGLVQQPPLQQWGATWNKGRELTMGRGHLLSRVVSNHT